MYESHSPVSGGRIDKLIRGAITFGVEEEFLLIDPDTYLVVPKAAEVIAEIPADLHGYVKHELLTTQLEISTPICTSLTELRKSLIRLRSAAAEAAARAGCRLLPAGTGLLDAPSPPAVTENDRFAQQAHDLGALIDLPGLCACHVHVAVPDRDTAAAVSNHLRPWLPVLHAINTNSPFADGRDTGYASWRSMLAIRYPTSGPPPWLDSAAHHDEIVRRLISSGAMADNRMVYWFARLSPAYPTIEVRVGDVCPTVDETLFIAALIRALVLTATANVREGRQAPVVEDRMLIAAHWRASRFGLEGDGMDVLGARTRPAWDLVDRLIEMVGPVLSELGDLETVQALRGVIRAQRSGAARQRAVFAKQGHLRAVVEFLLAQTSESLVNRAYEPAGV